MKLMRAGTKKTALKRAGAAKSQHKKRKPFTDLDVDAGGDARTWKDAREGGGSGMGMSGGGVVYFFSAVVYARRDSGVKGSAPMRKRRRRRRRMGYSTGGVREERPTPGEVEAERAEMGRRTRRGGEKGERDGESRDGESREGEREGEERW